MTKNNNDDDFLISSYTVDDAIQDGSLIDVHDFIPPPEHKAKFKLGRLVLTPGVYEIIETKNQQGQIKVDVPGGSHTYLNYELYLSVCLERHGNGDWGNVPKSDGKLNDSALKHGDRIISSYYINPAQQSEGMFWVITEADRSVTTLLLPNEY